MLAYVEVIVVNRATKSLALWIQMVGRGSRITNLIYKDMFTVIDLGQNIQEHGRWSLERDWRKWFFSSGKRLKNQADMLATWECRSCGALNIKGELVCSVCGAVKQDAIIKEDNRKLKEGELEIIQKMPPPRAKTIIQYTKSKGEGSSFAFRLLERRVIELFIHYKVEKQFYDKNKERFIERVKQIYRPIYFAIIRDKELRGGHKTLNKQFERIIEKIDKLYN